MAELPLLDPDTPVFPDPATALDEPDGLLAIGGNLKPATLLSAYSQGIFPWYEKGQPLLWWSPDPRAVIAPGELRISRSLRKSLRQPHWKITTDQAFTEVMRACAQPRSYSEGTWITDHMIAAYTELHRQGHAHSIEVWQQEQLVGGLYGIAVGGVFCGESMFSLETNASKVAMVQLEQLVQQQGFELIDCQLPNPHLQSLGAKPISRTEFLVQLSQLKEKTCLWPDRLDSITV